MALQHVRSFLETSAAYLGLRPADDRQARAELGGGEAARGDPVRRRQPDYACARECRNAGDAA